MPDDGQQLNTSLFSNYIPSCYLDKDEVNAVRNGGDCTILRNLRHYSTQCIGLVVVVGR